MFLETARRKFRINFHKIDPPNGKITLFRYAKKLIPARKGFTFRNKDKVCAVWVSCENDIH